MRLKSFLMDEELLHFFWNSKFLLGRTLWTTAGESLHILDPGQSNPHQGPDFLMGRLLVDEVLWVGPIEIHLNSSDWNSHGHSDDPHYRNVVLHVVYEEDAPVFINGRRIYCLELKKHFPRDLLLRYNSLMSASWKIPCHAHLFTLNSSLKTIALERLMVERFEHKVTSYLEDLQKMNGDWERLLLSNICKYLFSPVNTPGIQVLLEWLNPSLLKKYFSDLESLEAILFGCSNLIPDDPIDSYPVGLKSSFLYLQHKLNLPVMQRVEWKFLRMRPSHFPTIRLAQLAQLLHARQNWFSSLMEMQSLQEYYAFFQANVSEYWKTHYQLDGVSHVNKNKNIGKNTIDVLLINAFLPILFAYGKLYVEPKICDRAFEYLQSLKAENNFICRMWKNYNFAFEHAGHSQGGIQLFQSYCAHKKCIRCLIGVNLLRPEGSSIANQADFSP